jgi:hypothetical protein
MAAEHTLFEYLYRDGGNFKAFGSVLFDGGLSEEQLCQARAKFAGDGLFVAEQLGLPPLYEQLYVYSGGPISTDHCWHEFRDIRPVAIADVPPDTRAFGPAAEFLACLLAVQEWRGELSPHFWLDA